MLHLLLMLASFGPDLSLAAPDGVEITECGALVAKWCGPQGPEYWDDCWENAEVEETCVLIQTESFLDQYGRWIYRLLLDCDESGWIWYYCDICDPEFP